MLIPKKDQADVMHSFWVMMKECENKVIEAQHAHRKDGRDPEYAEKILRGQVEGWFKQYNKITDDCHKPQWDDSMPPAFASFSK